MSQTLAVVLLFLNLCCLGCGNYHEDYGVPSEADGAQGKPGDTTLSFAAVRDIVFSPRCFVCHSQARGNQGGINLETYARVSALLSDIQRQVESDTMPLGGPPLGPLQKNILISWIQAGAPEQSNLPLPGITDPK
jgi:uncharacterized membrane protein